MNIRFILLSVGMGAAAILAPQSARAQSCGMECHTEYDCYEQVYACGTNADGTIMMCMRTVCEPVEVCVPKPCGARPLPDFQDLRDSLILPAPRVLPDDPRFPELEEFPELPELWDLPELPELREFPAFSR